MDGRTALLGLVAAGTMILPVGTAPPAAASQAAPFTGATASSSARGAGASRAVDGRRTTAWRARKAGAWWWTGRLARTVAPTRVRVLAARSSDDVRVAISTDGRRFRSVSTLDLRRGAWRAVGLSGQRARFIRVSGRSGRRPGGHLAELEVRLRAAPVRAPESAAAGLLGAVPGPLSLPAPPPPAAPHAADPPAPAEPEPWCQPRARTADPPRPTAASLLPAVAPDPNTAPVPQPSGGTPFAGVVDTPIDARHLTALEFRTRSHWLQPWRAYQDTPPTRRLRDAIGINFNVEQPDMRAAARLLAANGFRRARIEIPWGDYAYEDPTRLIHRDRFAEALCAVRDAGLRPLILLNSNDQRPVPSFGLDLELAAPVQNRADEITLTPESAEKVIPAYTGVDWRFGAEALIKEIRQPGNVAVLSKRLVLPRLQGATDAEEAARVIAPAGGTLKATVLKYLPFSPPRVPLPAGEKDFSEETLQGWLQYVETTTGFVREMLGTTAFDVEISNELNLNAAFWDINNYFDDPPFAQGLPDQVIVDRTVAQIRRPEQDLPGVRITNGFASQRPWDSGETSPAGLDALSKHYYPRNLRFPQIMQLPEPDRIRETQAVDATWTRTGTSTQEGTTLWTDPLTPEYDTFFPEFSLTGIATETIVRDLAPWTERFDHRDLPPLLRTGHGRTVAAPDGRVPEFWMTEIGLETGWAEKHEKDGGLGLTLSEDDNARIRAKAALRTLVSYVHKGMTQVDLYAAATKEWGLIGGDFWRLLHERGDYPGDDTGGPVMDGVRRLVATLGAQDVTTPRSLTLASIGDYTGRSQFTGDGSDEHPDLHDRDVLAFLPFQASDHRFVIPVYVMTRNLARVYDEDGGAARFDLPEERYQLTIGGTDAARVRATAVDPLTGEAVPVDVVRRTDDGWLVVEMPVTDSPRLLVLDDTFAGPELP